MGWEKEQTAFLNREKRRLKRILKKLVDNGKISKEESDKFEKLVGNLCINSEKLGYYCCCGYIHQGYAA